MLVTDLLLYRLTRGIETMAYPDGPAPLLPDRHGGALRVDAAKCVDGCRECIEVCPTEAIARVEGGTIALDLGRCIFCAACVKTCPQGAITQTGDHRMAARERADLVLGERGKEEVRMSRGRRASFVVRIVQDRRTEVSGVIERVATGAKRSSRHSTPTPATSRYAS